MNPQRHADGTVETPCKRICHIDERSGLCIGCRRTLAEIMHWDGFSGEKRQAIMRSLPSRG